MRRYRSHTTPLAKISCIVILASVLGFAQNRSPVAPREEQLKAAVNEAYNLFKNDTTGKNADYIPYLAKVDSKLFGISVVTTDNKSYTVGDINYAFSIQSISKVFTLALAMKELGADKVFEKIGSEPTGPRLQFGLGRGRHADPHRKSAGERGRDRDHQPDLRRERRRQMEQDPGLLRQRRG